MQSRLPGSDKILRHFQIISGFIWSSLTGYPRPCFRYSLSHIRLGIISITNNKWSLLINTLLFDCYFFVFCGGFFCVWKLTTIKQSTGNGSLLKNYWILKIIFLSNLRIKSKKSTGRSDTLNPWKNWVVMLLRFI